MSVKEKPPLRLAAAELRRLAVLADCDPRTIAKVASGQDKRINLATERARRILLEAGYRISE